MNENFYILANYLEKEGYSINRQLIKQRLYSDPDEGILPITNTLSFFEVKNLVATVPKPSFDQLPSHFICQINKGKQYNLVLVDKTMIDKILVISGKNKSVVLNKEEFLSHWTGLIIAIEKNEEPKTLKIDKSLYIKFGLSLCLILLVGYTALLTQSFFKTIYLIISIVGSFLSYFIIKEKLGYDETPSRFCTISKDTDCNEVLNSKESRFFKLIDLSDTSVIYFSFITLSFIYDSSSIIYFLLPILSLPLVGYSIYSQKYEIKKWCPLCLGIGLALLLQFSSLTFIYKSLGFSYSALAIFSFILGLVLLSWYHLKELLIIKQQNNSLVIENLTFRRNYRLFLPYYNSIKKIETNLNSISDICIGNKDAPITFLVVTNPLCEVCFKAHDVFMEMLQKYKDQIQVRFRFFVPFNDRKNPKTQIAEKLLDLYLNESDVFNKAFSNWFSKVKIKSWIDRWGVNNEDEKINMLLKEQKNWCIKNNIMYTPAILVNGKLFPNFYKVEDIENFIDALIDQNKTENFMHERDVALERL